MKQTGLKNNDDELTDAYGIENPTSCVCSLCKTA